MTANKPLNESFPNGAKFFTFYWLRNNQEILVGCLGIQFQIASYPAKRLTRTIVLPEFQGLGISSKMINSIAEYYTDNGFKVYGATFHRRLGEYRENSENWNPGHYNKREFKLSDGSTEADKTMSGIRDGKSMYRHYYIKNKNYKLNYDIIEYDNICKEIEEFKSKLTEENIDEFNILQKKRDKIDKILGIKSKFIGLDKTLSDEDNLKYKKKKRKVLTAQERKAIKDARKTKDTKNRT